MYGDISLLRGGVMTKQIGMLHDTLNDEIIRGEYFSLDWGSTHLASLLWVGTPPSSPTG